MKSLVIALLLLFSTYLYSQSTTVSATVTDPGGQAWYGGTYDFQLIPSSGVTSGGAPLPQNSYHFRGLLDNTGSFSISIPDNTTLAPAGSYWHVTICSQTSSPVETTGGSRKDTCFSIDTGVSGSTTSLTTPLSSKAPIPLVNALLTPFAYSQAEMQTTINGLSPGGVYWDLTAACLKVWSGSAWACLGGGVGLTNITASLPIVVTPSPITGTGVISCPTCSTSSGIALSTNSVLNLSQTVLNLINSAVFNGLTFTVTNTSGGIVQLGATGTLNNPGLTNSQITINTASPLGGGGTVALGGTLNLTCTTCVTGITAGNLAPLFTTSVTGTTVPNLAFTLSNATGNTVFGNFSNSSGAPSYNVVSACGDATHALSWVSGAGFGCQALSPTIKHGISFTIGAPAGTALTAATTTTDYITVPFACTITSYNLAIDAGTITVKFWKIATGTAIPTSGNSINTSGVGISSGTAIHSTTLTDFTTTAVSAYDIMAMNVTAAATVAYVNGVLECN
jgi:hypothetical protein